MSLFKKILLIGIIVFGLTAIGSYAYLSLNGSKIFSAEASKLTQRKVSVKRIYPIFPSGIGLEGLKIEELAEIAKARVSVNVLSLLGNDIELRSIELEGPVFFFKKGQDSGFTPVPVETKPSKEASANGATLKRTVILKSLKVHNGEFRLKDEAGGRDYIISEIQGEAHNVPLTYDAAKTDFFVSASLEKLNAPFVGHFATAKGWVNWVNRDMDAQVQTMDDDGRVGLSAGIQSNKNDAVTTGHIRLTGGQQRQAQGDKSGAVENLVLGVLSAISTDIDADFSFRTKLDRFEVGKLKLSGKISSGLNSFATSGNIVENLKAVGQELLDESQQSAVSGSQK